MDVTELIVVQFVQVFPYHYHPPPSLQTILNSKRKHEKFAQGSFSRGRVRPGTESRVELFFPKLQARVDELTNGH